MARILCTEDDADARELLAYILTDAGYEVICAEDAKQALALAKTEDFDLYVLDNWLPDQSGENLCQTIRELDPKTPILFHSGAALEADKKRAYAAGAQGYLIKPSAPDEILAEVSRLIARPHAASNS